MNSTPSCGNMHEIAPGLYIDHGSCGALMLALIMVFASRTLKNQPALVADYLTSIPEFAGGLADLASELRTHGLVCTDGTALFEGAMSAMIMGMHAACIAHHGEEVSN